MTNKDQFYIVYRFNDQLYVLPVGQLMPFDLMAIYGRDASRAKWIWADKMVERFRKHTRRLTAEDDKVDKALEEAERRVDIYYHNIASKHAKR